MAAAEKPSLAEAMNAMEKAAVFVDKFSELRTALAYAAGLDQVTRELEASADAARTDVVAAQAELEAARNDVTSAKGELAALKQAANEAAKAIQQKAQDRADAILADAAAKSADADKAVEAAKATVADLQRVQAETQAELDALTSKLESAKAKIAKLLE